MMAGYCTFITCANWILALGWGSRILVKYTKTLNLVFNTRNSYLKSYSFRDFVIYILYLRVSLVCVVPCDVFSLWWSRAWRTRRRGPSQPARGWGGSRSAPAGAAQSAPRPASHPWELQPPTDQPATQRMVLKSPALLTCWARIKWLLKSSSKGHFLFIM